MPKFSYDSDVEDDDTYLRRCSAYSASVKKKAVGLGFSLLFDRICTELDIHSMLSGGTVSGDISSTNHYWNIVSIAGRFYNLDASLDSGRSGNFKYFLHSYTSFSNHQTDDLFKDRHNYLWETYGDLYRSPSYSKSTKKYTPDAPELTAKYNATTGSIELEWSPVENATSYRIFIAKDPYSTDEIMYYDELSVSAPQTTYKYGHSLHNPDYYYFSVVGCGKSFYTDYSDVAMETFMKDMPAVTVETDISTGKPKMSWEAVPNAPKYNIYRSTTGYIDSYEKLKTTSDTSFTDTSAVIKQKYYYKVAAVNAYGTMSRDYSEPVSIVCKIPAPTVSLTNNTSTGKPVIKWTAVDGAKEYQLYRSTTGKDGSYVNIKTTTDTSFTNTSAVAGTKYYYKVKAIHATSAVSSVFSSVKYITCDLPKPTMTLSVKSSTGKPVVSWNAVDGAKEYQVYRSTTGADGSFVHIKTATGTSFTNTSAVAGTKYYYKVKAIHATSAANSAFSGAKYITCDLPAPTVTVSINASNGKPVVKWNAVDGAKEYQVYRSTTDADCSFVHIKTATGTSFTNTSAVAGTKYYYKVKAIHTTSAANSAMSGYKYITCDLPKPTVSLSINATNGKPAVSWNAIDGAKEYQVYRSTTGADGSFVHIKTTTGTSFTNTSAVAGTKYYYKVKAIHTTSAANSAFSNTVSVQSR